MEHIHKQEIYFKKAPVFKTKARRQNENGEIRECFETQGF